MARPDNPCLEERELRCPGGFPLSPGRTSNVSIRTSRFMPREDAPHSRPSDLYSKRAPHPGQVFASPETGVPHSGHSNMSSWAAAADPPATVRGVRAPGVPAAAGPGTRRRRRAMTAPPPIAPAATRMMRIQGRRDAQSSPTTGGFDSGMSSMSERSRTGSTGVRVTFTTRISYPGDVTRISYTPSGTPEIAKPPSEIVTVSAARPPLCVYILTFAGRPPPAWTTRPKTPPEVARVVKDHVALGGPHSYWSFASTRQ